VAAKIGNSGQHSDYPLAPIYLTHVSDDGAVLLPYPQAKRILDRLKRLAPRARADLDVPRVT